MAITSNPYLTFPENNTREAFTFYARIFRAEPNIMPLSGMTNQPDDEDLVMHAELRAEEISLMASDNCTREEIRPGSNLFTVGIMGGSPEDEPRAREIFEALAEGGEITMPFGPQEWGDLYGQLTDRFGVQWAVNVSTAGQ